jgi:membrane associated rhomboid family serine protease
MGIYDRDYYRNDRSSYFGSWSDSAPVCKWLIIINIGMFLLQIIFDPPRAGYGEPIVKAFILDDQLVLQGQVWRLLTYAFLHDGPWHIFFNMLFLWWFGHQLETLYGPREFLALYLIAAVVGGIAFFFQAQLLSPGALCLGASGAVTAVMLLYALNYPDRRIYLFFMIPIPIWLFVGFQIARDLIGFTSSIQHRLDPEPGQSNVAYSVHLAGAALGFLYFRYHWRFLPFFQNLRLPNWGRRPKLRVYHGQEREPVAVAARPTVDEQFEAKLDAVLEKIKLSGQDSLTENEREVLRKASEFYKQRRH